MHRLVFLCCAGCASFFTPLAAKAALVPLHEYRTVARTPLGFPSGLDVAGLQMNVEVTETADRFRFTVTNDTAVRSAMNVLFFESGLAALMDFDSAAMEPSAGVLYRVTTILKQAPGRGTIGWAGSGGSYRAVGTTYRDKVINAVNSGSGEQITVSFAKLDGAALADVLAISETTGRVVAHLRRVGGVNVSSDLVAAPVPEPGGAAMLAVTAGALLLARRRRA